ncbi:hypothetical protein OK348_15360 [Flavobacterium sp. MXW15]|uniref:Lipoprotein n=1 Tax=Xanthomonas chitinilytica TaxID=2989819 RepID=A0ABT3JZ42_9XANT|nr:hypothetical protein [Xanthomonas sp. H13-6]MCW4456167.1 hypothetical protein [Flavobacterium sp. MXW15]MCW4473763.1 hypothetical protein [Xanthomonas sp. H13-6]
MYRVLPFSVSVAALMLGACSTTHIAQVQPIDGVVSGQCHIDRVRGAVGLAAAPGTVERARVDSDSLDVRVVRGGDARGNGDAGESGGGRLTLHTGPYNDITALYCG